MDEATASINAAASAIAFLASRLLKSLYAELPIPKMNPAAPPAAAPPIFRAALDERDGSRQLVVIVARPTRSYPQLGTRS